MADNLADQPQRQHDSLRAMDEALREDFASGDMPELAPRTLVWRDGQLIYRSVDAPEGIRSAGPVDAEMLISRARCGARAPWSRAPRA